SLPPGDVAFRLNLVTVERRDGGPPLMADFAGGRLATEEARTLVADLASALGGDGIEVHAGIGYRHLLVWRGGESGVRTTPPRGTTSSPISRSVPRCRTARGAIVSARSWIGVQRSCGSTRSAKRGGQQAWLHRTGSGCGGRELGARCRRCASVSASKDPWWRR